MNWKQLQNILWLRWRLACNQMRRGGGGFGAVVTFIMAASAFGLGALCFVGGLLGGWFGLAKQSPQVIMLVCLVLTLLFLFFWLAGLLTELQRSEMIDLQKLMHLPVALGQMFVINYLASHFTLSLVMVVPLIFGLGLGLAVGRGPEMILLIPLALSMVFMVTAWTYCLRGWLAAMMTNPRRRRTVIMCITLAFVLLAQGPNLYFNVIQRHHTSASSQTEDQRREQNEDRNLQSKRFFEGLVAVQGFVPPLWLPVGAQSLAGGNPLPSFLGTLGCLGIGALGLRRAYRNTVQFYQGETGGKAAAKKIISTGTKKTPAPHRQDTKGFLEYSIPFAPEQSAALALATLRSLLRAPEVKMAWGSSFLVTLIIGASFLFRGTGNVPDLAKPFIATGSVIIPVFFLGQFFGNQFGFDRDGFRALMLSPADRRLILLGKNLAMFPVGLLAGALLIALTSFRLHLAPLTVLATIFQLTSVLLMAAIAGNLLSLIAPYRIQPGSMKPTKMPGLAMFLLMFFQMLFPMAMLPVFAGPLMELFWKRLDLPAYVPVNLIISAILMELVMLIYWQSLAPLGRLLHRREAKILAIIAVEVE